MIFRDMDQAEIDAAYVRPSRIRAKITASPIADNAPFASLLHRLEHLGGVGVHVESRELVAAHGPDVGEGRRK